MTCDVVNRPELEAQAGGEKFGLITGFAVKGDGATRIELLETETLAHQTNFHRADVAKRLGHDDDAENHGDDDVSLRKDGIEDCDENIHRDTFLSCLFC